MSCSPLRDCVDTAAFKSQLEPVYTTLAQVRSEINKCDCMLSEFHAKVLETLRVFLH
ncbi:hypothetical protein MT418_007107 [Batrachochytrium dendrobatidis]